MVDGFIDCEWLQRTYVDTWLRCMLLIWMGFFQPRSLYVQQGRYRTLPYLLYNADFDPHAKDEIVRLQHGFLFFWDTAPLILSLLWMGGGGRFLPAVFYGLVYSPSYNLMAIKHAHPFGLWDLIPLPFDPPGRNQIPQDKGSVFWLKIQSAISPSILGLNSDSAVSYYH